MTQNYHQSIDDILSAASPEQKLLWNNVFLTFGENIAVRQLYYMGATGATEFEVYASNKYYVCYEFQHTHDLTAGATARYTEFFNQVNAAFFYLIKSDSYYDPVAALRLVLNQTTKMNNFMFSRITSQMAYIKFIGFRITR